MEMTMLPAWTLLGFSRKMVQAGRDTDDRFTFCVNIIDVCTSTVARDVKIQSINTENS